MAGEVLAVAEKVSGEVLGIIPGVAAMTSEIENCKRSKFVLMQTFGWLYVHCPLLDVFQTGHVLWHDPAYAQ